jgi:hypothetical protein
MAATRQEHQTELQRNAETHPRHISQRPPRQSRMRTILRAPSSWSGGYPRPGTETGRPSARPRVPCRGRPSWSARHRPRRTRSAIDRSVWRCWPREHDVAGEVEAGIRCAAPFWRRRRGRGGGPGPVSTTITASCTRAGPEALLAEAVATRGDRQQIRGRRRQGTLEISQEGGEREQRERRRRMSDIRKASRADGGVTEPRDDGSWPF